MAEKISETNNHNRGASFEQLMFLITSLVTNLIPKEQWLSETLMHNPDTTNAKNPAHNITDASQTWSAYEPLMRLK